MFEALIITIFILAIFVIAWLIQEIRWWAEDRPRLATRAIWDTQTSGPTLSPGAKSMNIPAAMSNPVPLVQEGIEPSYIGPTSGANAPSAAELAPSPEPLPVPIPEVSPEAAESKAQA